MRLEFEGFGDVGGEAGLSMGIRTSGDRGFVHKTPSDALPSNASLTDAAFVAGRFRVTQSRRPAR